jgi:hypothetical protein
MTVVWGLDLGQIRWSKFRSSYMWNSAYYRRRTRFVVYQLAMILCTVSETLGSAALSGMRFQTLFRLPSIFESIDPLHFFDVYL